MYKKFFVTVGLLFLGLPVLANSVPDNYEIKGFQNFKTIQKLNVINNLSAIADNDGILFTRLWPRVYFKDNGVSTYIYLTKNEDNSLDIVKFDYSANFDGCMTKENPEFCIPKITPKMETYIYNGRLLAEITPNFIENPQQQEISEILLKNGEYLDTAVIKQIQQEDEPQTIRKCDFTFNHMQSCQTFNKDDNSLISTEKIIMKEDLKSAEDDFLSKAFKYVKYNADNKKVEEYVFSNGKHTYYDKNGEITAFEQVNNSVFRYENNKKPDLYINVEFTKDNSGNITEELHYDRNNKLIRKYVAEYDGGQISKIFVEDFINGLCWGILPITSTKIPDSSFSIRY